MNRTAVAVLSQAEAFRNSTVLPSRWHLHNFIMKCRRQVEELFQKQIIHGLAATASQRTDCKSGA